MAPIGAEPKRRQAVALVAFNIAISAPQLLLRRFVLPYRVFYSRGRQPGFFLRTIDLKRARTPTPQRRIPGTSS